MRRTGKVLGVLLFGLFLITVTALLWPATPAPLPSARRDHILTNVHVIDIAKGLVGPVSTVRIEDGRISAVEAGAKSPASPALNTIDGRGGFVIPGLWDMHSHSFQVSPQLHFPLQIANGVTGVRDMMGCPEDSDPLIACAADKDEWDKAVRKGRLAGPRFIGSASFYFDNAAMAPDETEDRARRYIGAGADYLKVYNRLSHTSYSRLAAVSRESGVPMVGHLPKAVALEDAIAAGQSSFEHAKLFVEQCFARSDNWRRGELDDMAPAERLMAMVDEHDADGCDRLFALMAADGAWFVPTHVTREEDARAGDPGYLNDDRLDYADPLSRWAWNDDASATRERYPDRRGERALQDYFAFGLGLTGRAYRAGVPILVGTDTIIGGFRIHDEMALLVRAGLTPAEVLRAATLDAARYAGKEERFGTIEVGKNADILLLSANPLADIGNTRAITDVFIAGHHYDRALLDRLLEFTKAQAANPANWIRMLWGFATSPVSAEL